MSMGAWLAVVFLGMIIPKKYGGKHQGPGDPADIDPGMLVKAGILDGYHGFLQEFRDAVDGDPIAFLRQNPPDETVPAVENLDGCVAGCQRRPGSEIIRRGGGG